VYTPHPVLVSQLGAWQWVCWRYELRGERWTKPPYHPVRGRARVDDPTTWSSFAACDAAVRQGGYEGVGIVLRAEDQIVAVDLDKCVTREGSDALRHGELAALEPWAAPIVAELRSYTEISPSGAGIRIFVRASLPAGCGNRVAKFEVYDRARFVTITGDVIAGFPLTIDSRQRELDAVITRMILRIRRERVTAPVTTTRLSRDEDDCTVLQRARNARNGSKFRALYDTGHTNGDHSAADLALCRMLAYWTDGDSTRIDRLFRGSALMRDKWDTRRGESTYGAMTIEVAVRSERHA
jgi:putative DNA primase/helicase